MTKGIAAGITLFVVALLAAFFIYPHLSISWLDAKTASPVSPAASAAVTTETFLSGLKSHDEKKMWVCPMHPDIMQDHPGTCPICGMDLVAAKNHSGHEHGVQIDTASIQKLGVRLATVSFAPIAQDLHSYGNVVPDGGSVFNVHSKFDGTIKKTYVYSIGQKITQGQVIYEIYSPELIMQQKEYLRFLERRNQILKSVGDVHLEENEYVMNLLMELNKERAKFFREGVSEKSLRQIEDSKDTVEVIKIVAEESGVVTQINAREGSFVSPANPVFSLADVAKIWVDVTLYPDQLAQIKKGDAVTVKNASGQSVTAKLDFINTIAENNKVSARVEINNQQDHFRPGSFVDVIIHTQARKALLLPRSAVMHTGDGERVMLARGDGHFLPVNIETGIENDENVEVVDGLLEGAQVAVNGQFLLDAAASLNATAQRMQASHIHP